MHFLKNAIALKGAGAFWFQFQKHTWNLNLFVKEAPYSSLFRMNWFEPFGIGVTGINQTTTITQDFDEVCCKFSTIFDGQLGL